MMKPNRLLVFTVFLILFLADNAKAQDSTSLMKAFEKEGTENQIIYASSIFKTTRIVDGQSVETLPRNVLDVRISHRFGPISSGIYNLFGLDNATMRLGFDYGLSHNVMIGVGHSTYQKTYDAFLKFRLLRQSSGRISMPVTVSFVPVVAINTLRQFDSVHTPFSHRVSTVLQLLIARKFSEKLALQLMPSFVHTDDISFFHPKRNVVAIGAGGRYSISKRVSLNAEYFYRVPGTKAPNAKNVLSFGVDILTGGHVFQLHLTNSFGLSEKSFISETTGGWGDGDILFGFNISRVFQLNKKRSTLSKGAD
jgi:hypothetical protein